MESACRLDAEIGETSGRSAAWLARYLGVVEVVGSNPAGPIGENPWFPCDSKGFFVSWSLVAISRSSRPGDFAVGDVARVQRLFGNLRDDSDLELKSCVDAIRCRIPFLRIWWQCDRSKRRNCWDFETKGKLFDPLYRSAQSLRFRHVRSPRVL